MDNALARLVAWQQGGPGRSVVVASQLSGGWMASLDWPNPGSNYTLRPVKYADTPEAAIDAAMGAFEEWERKGTA